MPGTRAEVWNRRFANAGDDPGPAAAVLDANRHLLPSQGRALDLACGLGANALLLARLGLSVDAWDFSSMALGHLGRSAGAAGLNIATRCVDLEGAFSWDQRYEVIVVSRYLHRPLCPRISAGLAPGGLLFYQTFTRGKCGTAGPSRPEFLLKANELLALFRELSPVFYREDGRIGDLSRGERNQALFVGQKICASSRS